VSIAPRTGLALTAGNIGQDAVDARRLRGRHRNGLVGIYAVHQQRRSVVELLSPFGKDVDQGELRVDVRYEPLLNTSSRSRAFKITQDRPLSIRDRRVLGPVDVLAFLKAQDRLNDACCERRRVVTAFEHEEGPAVAILSRNFSSLDFHGAEFT
jgi:hypothetical protein